VFRAAVDKAGMGYRVDCERIGEPVYVDREMWEKIVLNLVSNAFKFTLDGEIHVTLRRTPTHATLEVRDTGSGIPAGELAHIFERFHRAEATQGRTHEGTGIGLALVQELVKLHGGTIEVASTPARAASSRSGSRSAPAICRPTGSRRRGRCRRTRSAPSRSSRKPSGGCRMRPGHGRSRRPTAPRCILVADDNADMRAYIKRLLGGRWHVEVVGNGAEALAFLRDRHADLVITDVMMPALDGFGLLRELRAASQTRDVPVLLLSARAGEESRIEGLQAGANDYLVKPFSARELVARVEAQLLRAEVHAVEESHNRRLATIFAHAPVAIAILKGPQHVFEFANESYLQLAGGGM
jgi:CheY-like chemotaxis protein